MHLSWHTIDLEAAGGGFRIARENQTAFRNIVVEIDHAGAIGRGEAAPRSYFDGEDEAAAIETVNSAARLLGDDPFRLEEITGRLAETFPRAHAALAAIDEALHDLVGKLLDAPMWRLFGLSPEAMPPTSFTIGLDEPEVMADRARAAAERFHVLKIKIGTDRDAERIRAIREVTDLPLRVDANTGWTREQAVETINQLTPYGIEFVEQPVAPGDPAAFAWVRERVDVPVMADESAIRLADLPELVGCVDAINIKLTKCGGLREALRMIHFARAHSLGVMLGCMLETSLGISAAAQLGPLADWLDLDGHLLLAADPFEGVGLSDGRLVLRDESGLGVREAV